MKELTTEQKAQRYDEAIEKAKSVIKQNPLMEYLKKGIEYILPELKESEDEKIKGAIIHFISHTPTVPKGIIGKKTMLAWLEKQGKPIGDTDTVDSNKDGLIAATIEYANKVKPKFKVKYAGSEYSVFDTKDIDGVTYYGIEDEPNHIDYVLPENCEIVEQKSVDKIEPKFHKGDWVVVSTTEGDRVVQIASVEYFKDGYPSYITTEGRWFGNGTKARLLTDKDVGTITLPESRVIVNQKPAWSEEDENIINHLLAICAGAKRYRQFAGCLQEDITKYQTWLKSLRPQPKQEWSQNDIDMIDWLIRCCEKEHEELCNDKYGHQDIVSDLKRDCRKKWDWLESLKNRVAPQKQWKPSKEQIKVCKEVYADILSAKGFDLDTINSELNRLEEELKKLKE